MRPVSVFRREVGPCERCGHPLLRTQKVALEHAPSGTGIPARLVHDRCPDERAA